MIVRAGIYDNTGNVVNIIMLDTESTYEAPLAHSLLIDETVRIGDTVIDGVLQPRPEDVTEETTTEGEV